MSPALSLICFSAVIYALPIVISQKIRYEYDICREGPHPWICRRLGSCQPALAEIRKGKKPEICSFAGLDPIVCCPPSNDIDEIPYETSTTTTTRRPWDRWPSFTTASPHRQTTPPHWQTTPPHRQTTPPRKTRPRPSGKAKQMCQKYAEYVFSYIDSPILSSGSDGREKIDECGRVEEPLIVGGTDARAKEFPHMVQIGYGENPRIAWLCGGSLISDRYVLSAAHCSRPATRGAAKWARLGDLDTSSDSDNLVPLVLRIVQIIDHPMYDSVQLYNDIALYKLENKVELNTLIRPICLHTEHNIPDDSAIASGWGHTNWGGRGSSKLQKVRLNLVTTRFCNDSYKDSIGRQLPNGIIDSLMLCAGGQRGKDTCQGDSGGPLQIPVKKPYCMYAQIGVTSFGKECGQNTPGVYTRVSKYVSWIESIVWP